MNYIIDLLIIVTLGYIVYQDIKLRKISWVILPVLFIVTAVSGLFFNDLQELSYFFLINLGFIAFQMLCLTLYFSIKHRSFTNIINKYIGIGDLLFFTVICAMFSPVNFIAFYLSSIILITIISLGYVTIKKNSKIEIPFAGAMAVILICCFVYKNISGSVDFYNDTLTLELLNPYLWII